MWAKSFIFPQKFPNYNNDLRRTVIAKYELPISHSMGR